MIISDIFVLLYEIMHCEVQLELPPSLVENEEKCYKFTSDFCYSLEP